MFFTPEDEPRPSCSDLQIILRIKKKKKNLPNYRLFDLFSRTLQRSLQMDDVQRVTVRCSLSEFKKTH